MVSAFTSRRFGFGKTITDVELGIVNRERRFERPNYSCEEATVAVHNSFVKVDLETSPFVREFYYGGGESREGWWNSDHMCVQMEDVLDVMATLHPDLQVVFEVDHSSGHDRKCTGGLSTSVMARGIGGKQEKMNATVVTRECVGPFYNKLKNDNGDKYQGVKIGREQSMVFIEGETPRFSNMARDDVEGEEGDIDLTPAELKVAIATKEPTRRNEVHRMKIGDLKALAVKLEMDVTKRGRKTKAGYMGKAKGALQVAYERGFVDSSDVSAYNVKKLTRRERQEMDYQGIDLLAQDPKNLLHLLDSCEDFINTHSQIKQTVLDLGGDVVSTPICHPELAGEGIEYCWGRAKYIYRRERSKIEGTIDREKFNELVTMSLSNQEGEALAKHRALAFARRARTYKVVYNQMFKEHDAKEAAVREGGGEGGGEGGEGGGEAVEGERKPSRVLSSFADIERRVKALTESTYKRHRGVHLDAALYED